VDTPFFKAQPSKACSGSVCEVQTAASKSSSSTVEALEEKHAEKPYPRMQVKYFVTVFKQCMHKHIGQALQLQEHSWLQLLYKI
jgi:hypothetical protein